MLRLEFYILLFLPRNFIAGRRQAGPSITPGVMDDAKLSANSCNAIVRAVAQSILSLSESWGRTLFNHETILVSYHSVLKHIFS